MDLKLELPQKLYDDLKRNKSLKLVEAITNSEHNLISVDICDIEKFKDKDIIERIDYKSTEPVPSFDIYPQSMIVCFNITKDTTLAEVFAEVDKITDTFITKDIVFGTNVDDSIKDKTIGINCLLFRNLEWKDKLNEKFYNDIVRCGFLKSFYTIISLPSLISIEMEDFLAVSNDEVIGAISQYISNPYEELKPTIISDKYPNRCIIYITSKDGKLMLSDIDIITDKIRKRFGNIDFIFGCGTNLRSSNGLGVHALLLHGNEEAINEKNDAQKKETDELVAKRERQEEEYNKIWMHENELIYNVAMYCKNNPITVNGIQNAFDLGFNRVQSILQRLERLQIISIKIGTRPRTLLIDDEDEIKYRIRMVR